MSPVGWRARRGSRGKGGTAVLDGGPGVVALDQPSTP
mgnify:CR=1 FL=1